MNWIKCSDKLPPKKGKYIIYRDIKYVTTSWFNDEKKFEYESGCCDTYEYNDNEVTHWMPLPEPPKD